ncbi:dihydropteroate synthase [Sedimentitalea sp. JM2-8]|uniref:Dihydropteroate synthase n=1 Tax=Sedimentitalea xiamensis TaxID=3050037 RepID=A0ABT7FL93_9RHOB|nr:dihydropteroate synthase [Sedimentitalea xiamensis]MDK3075924.1 dihydropteroate synthase [Sedimentitalea xiamensis]
MTGYYRPLVQQGAARPAHAFALAGGPLWFTHAERISRSEPSRVVSAVDIPDVWRDRLSAPRAPVAGLGMTHPQVMGILNVTPDSFSDGGKHAAFDSALNAGLAMVSAGAAIIDIGGESTRPGAEPVPDDEEIRRTAPVIAGLQGTTKAAISIDTRKHAVARAALDAGATLVNDVSGFTFDADLAPLCAERSAPVCIMHARGDPATMQDDPRYDDVRLDVYDFLETRVNALVDFGMPRGQILIDPGIGFGKTQAHNLALLENLSLFHGIGCAILLGVSRKGFIGRIGQAPDPETRFPGSIAVGLAALAQGVQVLRVHDVAETVQAVRLWNAVRQR